MATLHVLQKSGADITVAAHITIPSANNSAGLNWQTALIRSGVGGTTILPDGDGTGGTISAAEKAQIQAGSVYEVVETIHVTVPAGAAAINAYLDALTSAISSRVLAELQDRLGYFGYTRP